MHDAFAPAPRSLGSGGLWCAEYEVSSPERQLRGVVPYRGEPAVRILARIHGEPLGYVELPAAPTLPSTERVDEHILDSFGSAITNHLAGEGVRWGQPEAEVNSAGPLPSPSERCPNRVSPTERVSVVVCTRNRSDQLRECLSHLSALTYPQLEVIVVDNAPSDDRTRDVVRQAETVADLRYVVEPRAGLSRARNRGLAEATGTIVAYTDDDVAVDPQWIDGVVRGFTRSEHAGCVTGLVCTAALEGAAEAYFEARASSWSTRMSAQVFDLAANALDDPLYPYSAGIFGTGANFAFDRSLLLGLGGFDEALGAGTPTRGGEDLDMFVRVLNAGRSIVYEPSAITWHYHRSGNAELLQQMFGYGTGLTAFLTKCLLRADTRRAVLSRIPPGVRRMAMIADETEISMAGRYRPPRGALIREFAGFACGPVLYARSRRGSAAAPHRQRGPR